MLQFISFLTPASAGDISFTYQTFDATVQGDLTGFPGENGPPLGENVQLTVSFAASSNLTCDQIAYQVEQTFDNACTAAGLDFQRPLFYDEGYAPTFRTTRTEHSVCIFSECQFELTLNSNTTGSIVVIEAFPVLANVEDFRSQASYMNVPQVSSQGVVYTDQDIASVLTLSSAEATSLMHNNVVKSTYVFEEVCSGTTSIILAKTPIISVDAPNIRRPGFPLLYISTADLSTNYAVDRKSGVMTFRFAQDLLYTYEAFDIYNDFRVSYTAGYKTIPDILRMTIVRLTSQLIIDNFVEFQEGTFRIKKLDRDDFMNQLLSSCRQYFLSGNDES